VKRFFIFFLISAIILSVSGCKSVKKLKEALLPSSDKKQIIKPVESVELAQAIIWPKPYHFTFKRDPFRPLTGKESLISDEKIGLGDITAVRISGIVAKQGKPVALLELPEGTNIFYEGDKLGKYTVKKIEPRRIILEAEDGTFMLEMGEEK
jgi:hypothetical protein